MMDKDKREWFEYLAGGGGGDFTDEHCELAADALKEIAKLEARGPVVTVADLKAASQAATGLAAKHGGDHVNVYRKLFVQAVASLCEKAENEANP